jgi:hypothetical protein
VKYTKHVCVCAATLALAAYEAAPRAQGALGGTSSIAGRIIQPDGAAAENARVSVYAVREDAPGRTPAANAISSYDGRYEIGGLSAGTYVIGVTPAVVTAPTPRGVARPSPVETFYPDTTIVERAHRLQLVGGVPVEGIDVWLSPAPQRYTVSGRVFFPDGIEPRQLVIEYGGPDVIRRGIWYVFDPGGLFEIEGVAQGPLMMLARAETNRGIYMGVASTVISVESVQDVRIAMRVPGRIDGVVVLERDLPPGTSSLIVTPIQTLLKLSALYPVQEVPLGRDRRFRIPDALGTYTFDIQGLPQGWRVKRVRRSSRPAPDNRIVVGAGEVVTGVEVFVGPGFRASCTPPARPTPGFQLSAYGAG